MRSLNIVLVIFCVLVTGITFFSVAFDPTIENVQLSHTNYEMVLNTDLKLYTFYKPKQAKFYTYDWESSDPNIASVSQYGKVTAINVGSCVISVKTSNNKKLTCNITVLPILAQNIDLSIRFSEVPVGYTQKINYNIEPDNTTFKEISWSFSQQGIVSVDEFGILTALKPGIVDITAMTYGGTSKTISITVKQDIEPSEIKIDFYSQLLKGQSEYLKLNISPALTTKKEFTYISSNPSVASIDNQGKVVALKEGTTTITVKASNGISDYITLKVKEYPATIVILSAVKNNTSVNMTKLKIGDTFNLKCQISSPVNSTTTLDEIKFLVSDEEIATISENLVVTIKGYGEAVIGAYLNDEPIGWLSIYVFEK